MRLWSICPNQLDAKGLVAAWREGLLAQKVLQHWCRGENYAYQHHPQLERFKQQPDPEQAIADWLWGVYAESWRRGYHFESGKINLPPGQTKMTVTVGQLEYERRWLQAKVDKRAPGQIVLAVAHHIFTVVPGPIAPWERT